MINRDKVLLMPEYIAGITEFIVRLDSGLRVVIYFSLTIFSSRQIPRVSADLHMAATCA